MITRNACLIKNPNGEEKLTLLEGQKDFSCLLGMNAKQDEKISEFKDSEIYQDCFFGAPSEKRYAALKQAQQFDLHQGEVYLFPPSPDFYWRRLPSLRISTSLVVREIDNLSVGDVTHLINDTLFSTWQEQSRPPDYQ